MGYLELLMEGEMEKINDIPLGKRFPKFDFAKKADRWLECAKKATIFQQLGNRKISTICIIPILSTAALAFDKTGGFQVWFNTECKMEWAFGSLGHEIAHTFHFDLTKNPPTQTIDDQSDEVFYDFDSEGNPSGFIIEDFCDEFSKKWVTINTKEKIASDCKNDDDVLTSIILIFSNLRA